MVPFLARNDVRLLLTSLTVLFVELMLIRWIPANVRYVGFFSNFLLMASFLGIGLGILLGRRGTSASAMVFAILLLAVVGLVISAQLDVQIGGDDELFFGLSESNAADVNFLVLPLVIVLVTAVMAALASPLGPLLRSMRPLRAYAIDVVGSMIGVAGFAILSALGTAPAIWFGLTTGLVVLMVLGTRLDGRAVTALVAMTGVLVIILAFGTKPGETWSPYYRITTSESLDGKTHMSVNGIPHQALHPTRSLKEPFYEQIYRWFPDRTFERVLVIGAGGGSDVAIALERGARHVDAVEIDPAIVALGRGRHPDAPYADPRVRTFIDDGRSFLGRSDESYDLVIFALPDSLTLVSTQANVRLESFLFTEEAFAAVRDRLDPDGVFVLYNYYREDWLIAKLADMLESVFEGPPLVRTWAFLGQQSALAAGPLVTESWPTGPPGDTFRAAPSVGAPEPRAATDDWPFLYLRTPFVAPYYLIALALVLAGAFLAVIVAARVSGTSVRRFSPHFFILGVAFLLLGTKSLVSFSLLFGSTWLVNAMAFFAMLASVLLAIAINARWPIRRPWPFYAGLMMAIALAYLVPPESLLFDPPWLRYLIAAGLAFAPIFFANLVFSYSFRDTRTADMAFASNMLGATVGGALEYLALISGYQALLLLVALLYGGAWLLATRFRTLADVDLIDDALGPSETRSGRRGEEPSTA